MAWYSPIDDKIIGAEPGTLAYRHEEGHRASRKLGLLIINIFPHLIMVAIAALAYGLPGLAAFCFWFWIFLQLVNEGYAWGYAAVRK